MSATGTCAVVRRSRWPACLDAARRVTSVSTGKWIFRRIRTLGLEDFRRQWTSAVVRRLDFEGSGYVLGNYLTAQEVVNLVRVVDEESEVVQTLNRIFTAAFPFEQTAALPDFPAGALLEFCRGEYDRDALRMAAAIDAAHEFYRRGLREITRENLVVFVIE